MAQTATIDPAEFDEPAVPRNVDAMVPGSAAWAEAQVHADTETQEDRANRAQRLAQARIAAANARINEEAEAHKTELAKAAAEKQLELKALMDLLEPEEGRRVRMEAYLRAMDAGHGSQRERQLHANDLAFRIAKFMVEEIAL